MPFARFGFPYEITIKALTVLFSAAGVGIMLFLSPLPRAIRLVLPFTYYFFYQYTVISRPYGLLIFAFMLAAAFYKTRNERPLRFCVALAFTAFTHFLAFLFVFGIALAWLIEIIKNEGFAGLFDVKTHRRRLVSLCVLAVLGGFLAFIMFPKGSTVWANSPYSSGRRIAAAVFAFFISPAEAVFYSSGFEGYTRIIDALTLDFSLIFGVIAGLLVWSVLLIFAKRHGTVLLLILPYLPFAVFSSVVYTANTHTGVPLIFFVFWYWANLDKPPKKTVAHKHSKYVLRAVYAACAVIIAIPVIQAVYCSVCEIKYSYAPSREMRDYIEKYDLNNEDTRFWCAPLVKSVSENREFEITNWAVAFLPYFRDDGFASDFPERYNNYEAVTSAEYNAFLKTLEKSGYPDVFVLSPPFELIFEDDSRNRPQYIAIAEFECFMISKSGKGRKTVLVVYASPEFTKKHEM
jgi:hypothetical protein